MQAWLAAVYPRVGGGNDAPLYRGDTLRGLSPRGRGKPLPLIIDRLQIRSIPAWAGETGDMPMRGFAIRVYPRVGGGNRALLLQRPNREGLSPRGRGKRAHTEAQHAETRSIPAWAGETGSHSPQALPNTVYPRVGGGNRERRAAARGAGGLSPRGRGKQRPHAEVFGALGSIPAWAGETLR